MVTASTIKSRPVYPGLRAIPSARRNFVAVDGDGTQAVLRMLVEAPPDFGGRTHVLYAGDGGAAETEQLRALGIDALDLATDAEQVLSRLNALLNDATMGTRLYAAGSEGFVGRVVRLAIDHGIDHKSVLTEHSGTLARRVQCVHCKYFTERVTVSILECDGCGTLLFVRDHYSRRLAAFQGVCVNAENPTDHPAAEVLYP